DGLSRQSLYCGPIKNSLVSLADKYPPQTDTAQHPLGGLVCVGVFPPVVYMCKLSEGEHPLFLRLLAGPNTDTLGFVLREQQTGEWDAFSVPELSNFLRMLEKEETERVCSVTRRYDSYRLKLQEAMRAAGEPG
uniref:Ras association domain family member 3 n=1 Tax=Hucho hucho TaxID=62062 RepID=A0A4W5RFP2_9TELE